MESGYLLEHYRSRFGKAVRRQGNGWNGPCPICGGEPGKSDRFMVWPGRSESLGQLCAENQITGIWSCRQCGQSGDTIAYITKCEGLSFREALAELGIKSEKPACHRRLAPAQPVQPSAWAPKVYSEPTVQWQEQAQKLVEKAERQIWDSPEALAWLRARGIGEAAIASYRIGYLSSESEKYQGRFRPRSAFGLPAKIGEDGKRHDRLFIPRGILIPTLGRTGAILNIRIRRHKADIQERMPKYLELEGSCRGPMFLESSQARNLAVYFITEAELDAILIHHTSAGIAGAVAVRTNRGKPDARCNPCLEAAVRICVALDYDEAGAEGCDFWESHYPRSLRWPTPEGKDPGDAFALGVDIKAWISASLPPSVAMPEEMPATGFIEEPCDGQAHTACPGSPNFGGEGENSMSSRPEGAREKIKARAMAEDYTLEQSRWQQTQPDPLPWASEADFTPEELQILKKALPQGNRIDDFYLDVLVIWLLWRNLPVTFVRFSDNAGNFQGFKWEYDLEWAGRNEEKFMRFWRHQYTSRALWRWLSEHPATRINAGNLLRMCQLSAGSGHE